MKKMISAIKFTACLLWALMVLAVGTTQTFGQIIPPSTIVTNNWQTCGTRSQTEYPNDINVTQSPYNADNTGATDATAAIQAAINAETANHAVFFPAGKYLIKGSLYVQQNSIILRGVGTNTTLIGVGNVGSMLLIGHNGDSDGGVTDYISTGSTNGSTSITLTATPSFFVGDLIGLAQNDITLGTSNFPIMNVHQYNYEIQQEEIVTGISGDVVTLSDPIVWNFTNSPVVMAAGPYASGITHGVGLENLILTTTNAATGGTGSYFNTIQLYDCYDCWVTNCSLLYSYAYAWGIYYTSHITLLDNTIRFSQGSGADHAGLLTQNISGCLIANNIMADGLQPGIEFNGGTVGNAFFGNFLTNNIIDIDDHSPHPLMNLWEENVLSGDFEMDGYYGSGSHQTLLRNSVGSAYIPLLFKRWTTYMNVVGNVLGSPAGSYSQYTSTANNPSGGMIIQFGYPNIGNNSYVPTSVTPAWNYPLSSYPNGDNTALVYPSPIYTFTSNQGPTSNLIGNFTSIAAAMVSDAGSVYTLVIQDNNNTNLYYPTNGIPLEAMSAGTSTKLVLNQNVTVKAGMKLMVSGQNGYQQLLPGEQLTDTISGNYDYFNNAVTWNSGGSQPIPTSLLYPNGPPSWWGANRWPAIDPLSNPSVTMIPAEYLYEYGQPQVVANNPVISVTSANQSFGTVAIGATANQTFTVENTGGGTLTGSASVAAPFNIVGVAAPFIIVSGGSYSLGAGQSQTVTVSYSPTAVGTNSQTITFSGGAGASVTLTGTAGIPAPGNLQAQ
jgi:hypothetical protein